MDTKIIILYFAVAFALTNYVTSLRILGIFPYPGKSHFHVQRVLLQELARRGHSVTVISHFPETEDLSNYHDISLAGSTAKVISATGFDDFPFLNLYLTLLYRATPMMNSGRVSHPKTLAFFSHCGMAGTTEAIHFGVPVVAMPKYGDQPANAAAVEESGMGVRVQIENLTKDKILAAFNRVLDLKFRENVKRLSATWHDRPLKPLQTAVYWTEFAARHHNITLRTPAANLPFYQYCNLDILGVFTLFIIFIILAVKSLTRIYQSLKSVKFNSMLKENKKVKKH